MITPDSEFNCNQKIRESVANYPISTNPTYSILKKENPASNEAGFPIYKNRLLKTGH